MKSLLNLFLLLLIVSCSPSRIIEPLAVGERSLQFSTGGNFIKGANSLLHPAPSVSVSILKGLDTNVSTYSGIHISSFLYDYVHVELGALYGLRPYTKSQALAPGISLSFGFQLGTNIDSELRAWPETCLNLYYKPFRDESLVYIGIANYFEVLNRVPEEKREERHWLASPFVGVEWELQKAQSTFKVEYRPINYRINEDFQTFSSFYYPGKLKANALFIGLTKNF